MRTGRVCLLLWVATQISWGQNLVQYPYYELDANNDKNPDSWQAGGDSRWVDLGDGFQFTVDALATAGAAGI